MSRRPLDFYPTPPDVVKAVERWLDSQIYNVGGHWLDPAAGAGALLDAVRRFASTLSAYELDQGRRDVLAGRCDSLRMVDALTLEHWEPGAHVIANPPYNALEPFVERLIAHCRQWHTIGMVLTRVQWLDDGKQRHKRFRPDVVLRMPWRISFTGDGKTEATTHVFLVYLPPQACPPLRTSLEWLERPPVSDSAWEAHKALAGTVPQLALEL